MDPSARYVGQGHIWDSPIGKLTDRKIKEYTKAGHYGTQRALRLVEREQEKAKRKAAKRTRKARLILDLI